MTDGSKHFCGQFMAFLEVLAQLIASRSLYTASQVRNRLSLSRLHCKTWHFIKVFYLSDERHFVYLVYKCILIFQVKYLLYLLCFIKIIFLLTGNIATFLLPVIGHKAFLYLMTISSINPGTYKVIALVN